MSIEEEMFMKFFDYADQTKDGYIETLKDFVSEEEQKDEGVIISHINSVLETMVNDFTMALETGEI